VAVRRPCSRRKPGGSGGAPAVTGTGQHWSALQGAFRLSCCSGSVDRLARPATDTAMREMMSAPVPSDPAYAPPPPEPATGAAGDRAAVAWAPGPRS